MKIKKYIDFINESVTFDENQIEKDFADMNIDAEILAKKYNDNSVYEFHVILDLALKYNRHDLISFYDEEDTLTTNYNDEEMVAIADKAVRYSKIYDSEKYNRDKYNKGVIVHTLISGARFNDYAQISVSDDKFVDLTQYILDKYTFTPGLKDKMFLSASMGNHCAALYEGDNLENIEPSIKNIELIIKNKPDKFNLNNNIMDGLITIQTYYQDNGDIFEIIFKIVDESFDENRVVLFLNDVSKKLLDYDYIPT